MGGKEENFIFSNSYKAASLLKFYLPDHQEIYAQNIYNRPALQFDYWSDPDSLKGRDAIYVRTDRREYKDDLKYIEEYFKEIHPIDTVEINFNSNIPVRRIFIYHAQDYRPDGTK